jgi:hypothetical protein
MDIDVLWRKNLDRIWHRQSNHDDSCKLAGLLVSAFCFKLGSTFLSCVSYSVGLVGLIISSGFVLALHVSMRKKLMRMTSCFLASHCFSACIPCVSRRELLPHTPCFGIGHARHVPSVKVQTILLLSNASFA